MCALVAPLFLHGLGETYLWTDEAQTAHLGVSVLATGLPSTVCGQDSASAHCGEDAGWLGLHLQIPWLQAYLAAASIALFGKSSIAARLPFALLGLACVPLAAWLVGLAGARTRERILAATLTGTSVYFILHARQARYYALTACLTLLVAGAYWLYQQRRPRSEIWLATALSGLVLAFDVTALGVMAGVGAHGVWHVRREPDPALALRRLLLTLAVPAVLLVGWLGLASTAATRNPGSLARVNLLTEPLDLAVEFNAHVIPFLIFLPVVAGAWRDWSSDNARMRMAVVAACLSAGGALAAIAPPMSFPRYTIGLVPLMLCGFALLIGKFADRFRRPALVTAALCLLLMSGVPHKISHDVVRGTASALGLEVRRRFHPEEPWHPDLVDMVAELRDPPRGPVAAVVEHLRAHADVGDTVLTTYNVPGIAFHTDLAAFGGLTCALPTEPPDWIWLRAPWVTHRLVANSTSWLEANVDLAQYETITIDVPDRRFENRADIHEHVFRNPGPAAPPVQLLRRRPQQQPGTGPD